jgi:hypothetical protein
VATKMGSNKRDSSWKILKNYRIFWAINSNMFLPNFSAYGNKKGGRTKEAAFGKVRKSMEFFGQ